VEDGVRDHGRTSSIESIGFERGPRPREKKKKKKNALPSSCRVFIRGMSRWCDARSARRSTTVGDFMARADVRTDVASASSRRSATRIRGNAMRRTSLIGTFLGRYHDLYR